MARDPIDSGEMIFGLSFARELPLLLELPLETELPELVLP
jgi:hypothetical protein